MKTLLVALVLLVCAGIGWMAGKFAERAANYGEAERLQQRISESAYNDPELAISAMNQVDKLVLHNPRSEPIVIVNSGFQLRLSAGRTFPAIEPLGTR